MDTGFVTWEGEKIYLGDTLEANDTKRGVVKLDSLKGFYWEREDADIESGTITLKMAKELSSNPGRTLFHKIQPEKKEPWLLSTIESLTLKDKFKALYLAEEKHEHAIQNYISPTYADVLTWLMDHQVFIVVEPTIITNYRNHKYDCFTRFKYTIYTLNKVFQRKDEDGFDTWGDAMDWAFDIALDEVKETNTDNTIKDIK